MRRDAIIFIISGPSGSGKTTLINHVLKKKDFKNTLVKIKSFTTRPTRKIEREVKDYFFISDKEFRLRRRNQEFLETVKYLGYYYGTPRRYVEAALRKSKDVLLCIDVRGKAKIKKIFGERVVSIFVQPPVKSFRKTLSRRLQNRATDGKWQLQARINLSRWELKHAKKYDYVLVNDHLKEAAQILATIFITERQKRGIKDYGTSAVRKDYR